MRPFVTLACAGFLAAAAWAEHPLIVPIGTSVSLVTLDVLSSKISAKGDIVRLQTTADVKIDGMVAIPAGTAAVGQVVEARAKGAMGMSGQIVIRPLYLMIGSITVRLAGAAFDKATVTAGAVIGTVALGAPFFTGRSATIAAGTPIPGMVERTVTLSNP